ncbi:hypothetical protein SLEP1_g12384 [Rubroshorea leprosula]|uniref:Uncharacterized protein n=1 Tax=Rubroshorea leprosula TaxID=152421 RepID=A0AAV5IKC9_9ROSI|nr:hypothetical protein SLEP1_g12384 [Rubroshorea leprosula]
MQEFCKGLKPLGSSFKIFNQTCPQSAHVRIETSESAWKICEFD